MDGLLLLDKPAGVTSHDVVKEIRSVLQGTRVGHAGTLDPNATGLLVVLVGRATKISRFVMGLDKEYVFGLELGVETDTLDRWGRVVSERGIEGIDAGRVLDAASKFRGRYQQIAPSLSALKHRGTPLYKLARRGLATPLKTRVVVIREFTVLAVDLPQVTVRVVCSTGTYVRSLARDMGNYLGCGATVCSIRRLRVGSFGIEHAIALDDIKEGRVKPEAVMVSIEHALAHLPKIGLREASVKGIREGRQPSLEDLRDSDGCFEGRYAALTDEAGAIVAIAVRSEDSDVKLKTERVL